LELSILLFLQLTYVLLEKDFILFL